MAETKTLLITQAQVRAVLDIAEALEEVERAFRAYGEGKVQMPPKAYLHFERGDLRTMPAYLPDFGLATVKNVNVHPENADHPTVMATVTIIDPDTGFQLAIMDGTWLTALRTGAAGGVAARHLARREVTTLGFIGAGTQSSSQLAALMHVHPEAKLAYVCDADKARAQWLAAECARSYGLDSSVASAEAVVRASDILTTITPVREPIVKSEWVRPGTHINAIGADAPGKQELDIDVLKRAVIVVDNWEQAAHGGEINVAVKKGEIGQQDIHGDIGEVVAGRVPGRTDDNAITVFDSTGLAIQDCACAVRVYRDVLGEDADLVELRAMNFLD